MVIALPASMISMLLPGFSLHAPTAAAIRSLPNVCGVAYSIFRGVGVVLLNHVIGQPADVKAVFCSSVRSTTVDTIILSMPNCTFHSWMTSYVVSFLLVCSSNCSPLKRKNLALLLPMSAMRFKMLAVFCVVLECKDTANLQNIKVCFVNIAVSMYLCTLYISCYEKILLISCGTVTLFLTLFG